MKYQGSKSRIAKHIVPIIQQRLSDYNIKTYIEPFCLSGDTIIYTETGIKPLKDVNIGDKILDDQGNFSEVIQKVKSNQTNGIKFNISGNVVIKSTNNHIFYKSNGQEIMAQSLCEGDSLLIGNNKKNHIKTIDMSDYITYSLSHRHGRSGKIIDKDKIKLYHTAPITRRIIPIDKKLMQCYGLVVAEGDKSNITMNVNELNYLQLFMRNYEQIIGLKFNKNKKYYKDKNKHTYQLAVPCKTIYEKIFFQAMNIGYSAKNKNISFLFNIDDELVLEAIKYMIIGDGCLMNKKSKNGKTYRMISYKTCSKTLAHQLQTLLSIRFDIKSTICTGFNKERKIDNRILKKSVYYAIQITREDDIAKIFCKNEEIKIHEKTKGFYIRSIESCEDEFYDITINNKNHRFVLDGGIVTHNCGGLNVIDKVQCENKIASDINKYLIELLENVDKIKDFPDEISREHYSDVRDAYNKNDSRYEDWYKGAIGFLASYNGRFFDGGYAGIVNTKAGTIRNYYREARDNLIKQSKSLVGINFYCRDYKEYSGYEDCLFYCDPPYQGTKQYGINKNFDHAEFWDWVRNMSEKNIVLVSEHSAPADFECIWEAPVKRTIDNTKRVDAVERLFEIKE